MMTENSTQYLGVSLLRGEASELCGDGECCFEPYQGSRRCSSRWIQSPTRSKVHSNARAPEVHMQEKRKSWRPIQQKVRIEPCSTKACESKVHSKASCSLVRGEWSKEGLFQESIPLTKTKADIAKFNRTLPS